MFPKWNLSNTINRPILVRQFLFEEAGSQFEHFTSLNKPQPVSTHRKSCIATLPEVNTGVGEHTDNTGSA